MPEQFPSAENNFTDAAQEREAPETERDENSPKTLAERITREETNKLMPEMRRLVSRGLSDLFELLPKQGKAKKEEIDSLIAQTDLALMLPAMREKFAREMVRKKLNVIRDKADFIGKSLDTDAIKMFIHLEAMKGSTDAAMARLQESGKPHKGRRQKTAPKIDAARLAALRKEILGGPDDGKNVAGPLAKGPKRQDIDETGGRNPAL